MVSTTTLAPRKMTQVPMALTECMAAWKPRLIEIEVDEYKKLVEDKYSYEQCRAISNKKLGSVLRAYIAENCIFDIVARRTQGLSTPNDFRGQSLHFYTCGYPDKFLDWMLQMPHLALRFLDPASVARPVTGKMVRVVVEHTAVVSQSLYAPDQSALVAAPASQEYIGAIAHAPTVANLEKFQATGDLSPAVDLTSELTPIDVVLELEKQGLSGDLKAGQLSGELLHRIIWGVDKPQADDGIPWDPETITVEPPAFPTALLTPGHPKPATQEGGTITPESVRGVSSVTTESVQTAATTPAQQARTLEHSCIMDSIFPKDVQQTGAEITFLSPTGQNAHATIGLPTPATPLNGQYHLFGCFPTPPNGPQSIPPTMGEPRRPGQTMAPYESREISLPVANSSSKRKANTLMVGHSPKAKRTKNILDSGDPPMPKGPGRPVKERHIPQSVVPDTKLHQLFASVRRDRTNFVKKIPVTGKGVPHINVANDIALVGTANLSQQDVPSRAVHAASNGVDLDSQQNMGVQQGQMGFCQPSASPNMAAGGQPRVGNGTVQPSVNAPQEQMCFVQLPDGSVVPAGGQYRPGLYLGQPHMGPPQEKMGPAQPPEHPPMMRGQPCAGNFYNHQYQSTPLPHSFSPTPSGYMPSPMPGKYGYQSMPQQRGYSLAANSNMRPLPAPAQLMPYGTTHQPSSYAQPAGNFSSPFPLPQYQSQGGPQGHIIYGNNNTIYMPPPPAPWEQGNGTGLGMHESILHHNFHSAPVHLQTQPLASYPPHMMCQPRMAQQAMPYYNANSGFGNQQVTNGWD